MTPVLARTTSIALGLILLCTGASYLTAQQKAQPVTEPKVAAKEETHQGKPVSFWMKQKLDFSKNLLEGLASGDFDKIAQNAKTLRTLNKIEAFVRGRNPGYRAQLQSFEESLDEIVRQASKENVEGVTLGFNQLTISCVNCHKKLREPK